MTVPEKLVEIMKNQLQLLESVLLLKNEVERLHIKIKEMENKNVPE